MKLYQLIKLSQIFIKGFATIKSTLIKSGLVKDIIVGLDIGSNSIKLAQFAKKEGTLHLIKVDLQEISSTTDETSGEKEVLSALKKLLGGIDIKKSKFIVAINCPRTCIRRVTAPYMPKAELRKGIELEAKNYFPFPVDNALLDFQILGDVVEKGVKKYQIAVATSPKKTIDKYLSILDKVGIKPTSFIPIPYALQNLYEVSSSKEDQINCFLEIGQHNTELVIYKGKSLIFSRKIPIAGSDFTKAMTGVLVSDRGRTELSIDEAEKIKRQTGIPAETESKMIDDKISTTQILSMLRSPLEQLVNEIDRCFDYCREETTAGADSLVLFGGGASIKGLPEFLSNELGIEVKVGSPIEKVSHQFAVAIGAALSQAKDINLLPPEIKEETKRTFERATIQGVATAIILILAFIYIGMRIQLVNYQKRISTATLELSSLQHQLVNAEEQNLIARILKNEPYWEDVSKELSNIIPGEIYLTELSMKDKAIKIKGIIGVEEGEEILSNFILDLKKGIFKNVNLVTTKDLRGEAATEFELSCKVE